MNKSFFCGIFVFFMCLNSFNGWTQSQVFEKFADYKHVYDLDSLETRFSTLNPNDINFVHHLIQLEINRNEFSTKFGQNLNLIKVLSERQNSTLGLASYHYLMSLYVFDISKYESIINLNQALHYFETLKDTTGLLTVLAEMRPFSIKKGNKSYDNVKTADEYYNQIIALSNHATNPIDKLLGIKGILVYNARINKPKSVIFCEEALKTGQEIIDKNPNLAVFQPYLFEWGHFFYSVNVDFRKSLEMILKSFEIRQKSNHFRYITYSQVGSAYYEVGDFLRAEFFLKKSIEVLEQYRVYRVNTLLGNYKSLADIKFSQKKYQEAWDLKSQMEEIFQYNRLMLSQSVSKSVYDKLESEKTEQLNLALNREKRNLLVFLFIGIILLIVIMFFALRLKRANTKIMYQMNLRNHFFTMIAHDLRMPINAFSGIGKTIHLLYNQGRMDDLKVVLNRISEVGDDAEHTLDNLMAWGKSNDYKIIFRPEEFDISKLIKQKIEKLKIHLENKRLRVENSIVSKLIVVSDENCIQLILRNIFDNAVKYTPTGGSISITSGIDEHQKIFIDIMNEGKISDDKLLFLNSVYENKIQPLIGDKNLGMGAILINEHAQICNLKVKMYKIDDVYIKFRLVFK